MSGMGKDQEEGWSGWGKGLGRGDVDYYEKGLEATLMSVKRDDLKHWDDTEEELGRTEKTVKDR